MKKTREHALYWKRTNQARQRITIVPGTWLTLRPLAPPLNRGTVGEGVLGVVGIMGVVGNTGVPGAVDWDDKVAELDAL